MTYLYTPPTWRDEVVFPGTALRYGVATCTVVYRSSGVWHNIQCALPSVPDMANVDVDPSGLVLFFTCPTEVPDSLYTELAGVTPADPSWTAGTLTRL